MNEVMKTNIGPTDGHSLAEPMSAEDIALKLFAILDDIDTYDDLAKGNEKLYRNLVRKAHVKRFQYASTDGYSVFLNLKG